MKACNPNTQRLLNESSGYQRAVDNLQSDCFSIENPAANIPAAIAQSMEEACAAEPERDLTAIVADHQTIRRPRDYETRRPPGDKPLRRVVTLTGFLNQHLLADSDIEIEEDVGSFKTATHLFGMREQYRQEILEGERTFASKRFSGTTSRPEAPSWWSFPEDGREAPTDAVTYAQELMLGEKDIEAIRREGGVVISIPAHVLAGQLYKPCALDAFCENTQFRPDHSERPYGKTCPTQPGLKGHPELISRSIHYSEWQSRLEEIHLEWLAPPA